jgi:hypothetical protein
LRTACSQVGLEEIKPKHPDFLFQSHKSALNPVHIVGAGITILTKGNANV